MVGKSINQLVEWDGIGVVLMAQVRLYIYIYGCVKVGGTPDHPKLDQFLVLSNEFMFFGIHFMNPPYGIDRNIVVEYRNNSLWPVWTAMTMWNFFGGETYEKMVLPVLSPDPNTNVAWKIVGGGTRARMIGWWTGGFGK